MNRQNHRKYDCIWISNTSHRANTQCFGHGNVSVGTLSTTLVFYQQLGTSFLEALCYSITFGKLPRKISKLPIVSDMSLTTPSLTQAVPWLQEIAETATCSIWQVVSLIGNLTTSGNQCIGLPMLFYGFWQVANKSWQVAKSTH